MDKVNKISHLSKETERINILAWTQVLLRDKFKVVLGVTLLVSLLTFLEIDPVTQVLELSS